MPQFVIPTIFSAVDRMSGPVMRMRNAVQGLTAISGASGAALQRDLHATSIAAMEVATTAGIIGAAVSIPMAMATKSAIEFEKEMGNVSTLVDTTKESITALGDEILGVSKRVPVAISDLTESMYQIRSEGFGGAYAMELLEKSGRLAVAGLSSATAATKSMASAVRVFGEDGQSATEIADLFFKTVATGRTKMEAINESFGSTAPIVHEAGVSLREFLAGTAAMTNAGNTASEAMVALRGATIALIKPSGEMEEVFRRIGVSSGRELIKTSGGLIPAMKKVGDVAKQTGLNVNDAFGRVQGLTAYTLLTGSLSQQFEQDMKRMGNGVNEIDDAFAKQLGTTSAQLQIAKNNMQTMGIVIGTLLLPALVKMVQAVSPVIEAITNFGRRHRTLASIIFGSIATFGGFMTVLAGGALIIYAVTKSIMLWKMALGALNVVQNLAAIRTAFLSASLWAQLGVIGLVAAALGLLFAGMISGSNDVRTLNDGMDDTRDKFERVKKPIDDATLALYNYNNAVKDYNAAQDAWKMAGEYWQGGSYLRAIASGARGVANDVMFMNSPHPDQPTMDSIAAADTSAASLDHYVNNNYNKNDTAVNVYLNVDKNGNITSSGKAGGSAIPVKISSTGNTRRDD